MSSVLTDVSEFDSAGVTVPSSGDARTAASVNAAFQVLANRTAHANAALGVQLDWSGDFAVSGSAPNNISIEIGTISAIMLHDGSGGSYVHAGGGSSITQTKIEGGGGTLTAAAAWWYVYAYRNGTSLDYEISTTAPSSGRAFKSGGVTHRYLGCFKTLSTGVPITTRACRGRYLYRASAQAVADTRVLNAGVATSYTTVALGSLVPPHARLVTLRHEFVNTANAFNYAYLQTDGDSGADANLIALTSTQNTTAAGQTELIADASQEVQYLVTANGSAAQLSLWVAGWRE